MKIGNYRETSEDLTIIAATKKPLKTGAVLIGLTLLLALFSWLTEFKSTFTLQTQSDIFAGLNFMVILLLIVISTIKKKIYFSIRVVNEKDTLESVLSKWSAIDNRLLYVSTLIPVATTVAHILGTDFSQIWYIYAGGIALIFILMPMGIKVRSKLRVLRSYYPDI